ncbi:hypothetical protein AB0B63_07260 [Micromonospora sp. NPDC049081]|uniref:hypothetical protein n=1 Tax=Micromonospora sp. NPDC049081 TaxID=3155150 RepID=UPI0034109643
MTAPTITRAGYFMPEEPSWCVGCRIPDPGVVDHYSRVWEGTDWHDNTKWRIQVTQRVEIAPDGTITEGLAVCDINRAEGTYGSMAEFARAALLAEALKDSINAGRRRVQR